MKITLKHIENITFLVLCLTVGAYFGGLSAMPFSEAWSTLDRGFFPILITDPAQRLAWQNQYHIYQYMLTGSLIFVVLPQVADRLWIAFQARHSTKPE